MHEIVVAAAIFVCLVAASLGALLVSERLPARYRHDDTYNVVRLAANIFVVMTSLVLGLLLNTAKNTYEAVDRNVHAFATDLVLLDQTLRQLWPGSLGSPPATGCLCTTSHRWHMGRRWFASAGRSHGGASARRCRKCAGGDTAIRPRARRIVARGPGQSPERGKSAAGR